MALWPHQHLRKALEHYWNTCSKQQLILRELPEESSDLVTRNSELQRFRNELAFILRVIRLVTDIFVFGPVTTGFRAYAVQSCFCDDGLRFVDPKQSAMAVIDDITEQLQRCDAALRDFEAQQTLLAGLQSSTPAFANTLHNTGAPVVCRAMPCMPLKLHARPRRATKNHRLTCRRYLKRQLPCKRNRPKSAYVRSRHRHRHGFQHVATGRAALCDAHLSSVNARSLFPFNPGITVPWQPTRQRHPTKPWELPRLSLAGGPDSSSPSGHADMATAIECLRHFIESSATSSSKDVTASDVPASSRCPSAACDAPTTTASAADMLTGARDGSSKFTLASTTTDAS